MKRILALLLAMMMVFTITVPTLAEGEVCDLIYPDQVVNGQLPEDYCASPTPDGSVDIDALDEIEDQSNISLDDLEEWVYLVFQYCPSGQQTFTNAVNNLPATADAKTKSRVQELGNKLANKIPYYEYYDDVRDFVWYCCPRSFHCFTTCSVGLGMTGGGYYITGFTFSNGYKYDATTYQAMIAAIEAKEHYFLDGLQGNTGLTALQKVVLLHDRIVNWTEYDYDGYEQKYTKNNPDGMDYASYTMYGTIVRRDSVCQGISQAQIYLGKKLGLDIKYCHSSKLNHAWNIVTLNDQRYYMDTTWDDPVADALGRTKHQYLLCSKFTFGHDSSDKSSKIPTEADVDYERTCTDKTYDNAFWKASDRAAIQLVNNDYVTNGIYYFNKTSQSIMRWVNSSDVSGAHDEVLYKTGDTYSNLASDGERLFFTAGRTVYEWDFATSKAVPYWTLPTSLSTSYKIYGMQYDNRVADDFRTDSQMSAMTEAERAPYDYMRLEGDTGSKLWVRAATGVSHPDNTSQFNNVFPVELNGEGLESYTVTVTNGTASPSTAIPGEKITLKANAAESGMVFDKWVVDAGSAAITLSSTTGTQPTFTMPYGDVKVTATYKVKPTTMPETGYNYLVNGDFGVENVSSADFGWKRDGGAAVSVSNGVASVTNGNQTLFGMYERIAFIPGHNYTITGHVSDLAGELKLFLKGGNETAVAKALSNGDFTYNFNATSDMDRILFGGYKTTYKISNITLTDNTGGGDTPTSPSSSQSATTTTQSSGGGGGTVSGNLIVNGDFSNGLTGWVKSGSFNSATVNGSGQLVVNESSAYNDTLNATFTTPIKANTQYTLRYTGSNMSGLKVSIHKADGWGSGASVTATANQDTVFTTGSLSSDTVFQVTIQCTNGETATGTFDNFILVEGDHIPETSQTQPSETQPTPVTETYNVVVNNGTTLQEAYEAGATVSITAGDAATGYTFDQWVSEDGVEFANANAPQTTFTMPAYGVTVTAQFKKIDYTVTVSNGAAFPEIAGVGDSVTLVADEPAEGYAFDKWVTKSGSAAVSFASATSFSTSFTMPAGNVSVEATYKPISYTISVTGGKASKSTANVGDTITLTPGAAPSGKVFDQWTSTPSVIFSGNTFTMPASNVSITATYKNAAYTVTVNNGSASPAGGASGDIITITANAPASGKVFDKWTTNDGVTFANANNASTTFTMPAKNVTVTATYKDQPQETGVSTPQGVTATASADGITVSWNAVTGASGYRLYKKVNGAWNTVKTLNDSATTSYNVTGLNAGEAYTFAVQAFVTEGSDTAWSDKSADVTATATFGAPDVGTATTDGLGIKITWAKVNGATGYRIYRRTVENQTLGSWKTVTTIANSNTLTYTDTSVVIGAEYAYTVQSYTGSGDSTKWSTYDPYGMRGRVTLAAPILGTATKVTSGATITWNAVNGATGYRLYRWNGSAWKTVKTVLGASTVSYTDTNSKAVAGAKYTVQAFHANDGVVSWSEPNTTGVTVEGGSNPNPPTPTILGSEDIDLVTLTYFDDACTEYGVSFHSFAAMTTPEIQIVQGVASSAADFASAREIAVTDNYTKQLNEFKDYNKTDYSYYYNWSERGSITSQITTYIHQGVIDNLSFGTTYSYRVGDKSSNVWSGIYTFTTRSQNIGNFSLIYTADTQPENSDKQGWRGVSTIFQKALETAPNAEFFVSGGDFVYCSDDGMSSISPWRNTINGSNNLFGSDAYFAEHPWFVANGNHDNNYVQYFFNNDTTSTSDDYYSYDYGDVHFIVLDSGHQGKFDSTQLNWLESDLQATNKKFKVVFLHWPFYCHTARDIADGDGKARATALFDQYDVDFVVSAHVNEDYYTTYPLNGGAVDQTAVNNATVSGNGVTLYNNPTGPIYLQNAGSGLDGNLSQLGQTGVAYSKNGSDCSYPDLMMHKLIAGYETSFMIIKVEGNQLTMNRYYLDASGNAQRYTVGQVGVIKN